MARDHPGLVRRVVLAEPALLNELITNEPDKAEAQPILEAMGTSFKATVARLEAGNREGAIRTCLEVVLGPGTYERLPEVARGELLDNVHTLKANLTSAPEPFTCADARTLGVPALLIGGDVSPRIFPLWMNGLQPCLRTWAEGGLDGPLHAPSMAHRVTLVHTELQDHRLTKHGDDPSKNGCDRPASMRSTSLSGSCTIFVDMASQPNYTRDSSPSPCCFSVL